MKLAWLAALWIALVACSKPAQDEPAAKRTETKPEPAAVPATAPANDPVLAAMMKFRDRACACKDEACLSAVRDDMNKFSNQQALNPTVSPLGDAHANAMTAVSKQLTDCIVKVMSQ
ncbi:MAG TPA: hypothetical protein VFQ53_36605 [Kofleriaceae bacterium]|nr:hypothetical protein [Kofleriaceae bacterium]